MGPVQVTFIPVSLPHDSEYRVSLVKSLARSHAALVTHRRRRQCNVQEKSAAAEVLRRTRNSHKYGSTLTSKQRPVKERNQAEISDLVNYSPAELLCWSGHVVPQSPSSSGYDRNCNWQESRSLQFFIEKTSMEWPGYYDMHFWRRLALQASTVHPCIRHGLVALGAYHEARETGLDTSDKRKKSKDFAFLQGQKAVARLAEDHSSLSIGVLLIAGMVLQAVSGFVHFASYHQLVQMQLDLRERLHEPYPNRCFGISNSDCHFITEYLDPILERQRSKYGQIVDLQSGLRNTHHTYFYDPEPLSVPKKFSCLLHARLVLERILKWTTYQCKTMNIAVNRLPDGATYFMNTWREALDHYATSRTLSEREKLSVTTLHLSAELSLVLIRTMKSNDETIFDQFTPLYRELIDLFVAVTVLNHKTSSINISFGLENSLMTLCAGPALRWCRDPTIRRDTIHALRNTDRQEAVMYARVWADVVELTQSIEEKGIYPPPKSCHDIPAENRVRIDSCSFYVKAHTMHLQYLRYPYQQSNIEKYCISHPGGLYDMQPLPKEYVHNEKPSLTCGRGWASFLRNDGSGEYYTIQDPNFCFNLPRV